VQYDDVIKQIKSMADPKAVEGMARFGINPKNNYGVSVCQARNLAKQIGKDYRLARKLWASGIHDARLLATMVGEPYKLTEKEMDRWVKAFDSWDICDQCCSNLFDKTPFTHAKAAEWSARAEEFVKRAGFAMMACLAVHDKQASDKAFERFFPIIKREATDGRNYVRKAVNWTLRQIGKRNLTLNKKAVAAAKAIRKIDSKAARWVASDALRELTSEKAQARLKSKRR